MSDSKPANSRNNRRTVIVLASIVVLMFGFGFAMVPLYGLFCQVTGTQSLSQRNEIGRVAYADGEVDESRWVTVKFDTTVHPDLPWQFSAQTNKVEVHPGKIYAVAFNAHNLSHETVTGQAIPSIAPWQATAYFTKLECFCFNRQTLSGTQVAEMPLRFMVSPDLPDGINSLTLSYSFMRLKESDGIREKPEFQTRIAGSLEE